MVHCYPGLTTLNCFRFVLFSCEISQKEKNLAFAGMVGLSLGEKHFIQGGIGQDLRCDGRKRFTYKPISVETEVIPQVML